MRERPIGEIMSQASISSIADRGRYLTNYKESRVTSPASGERWRGINLKEPATITEFIFDISNNIDRAWIAEYKSASNNHFDIGAYARVAVAAQDLALNVLAAAFNMADSQDENQARVGKSVLFHRYLNSAISSIFQLKTQIPHLDFDPGPILDAAIEITQEEIAGYDLSLPLESLPHKIHTRVIRTGFRHLAHLTGFPVGYFAGVPGSSDAFQALIKSDDPVSEKTSKDKIRFSQVRAELEKTIYPDWNPEPTVPGKLFVEQALESLSTENRKKVLSARLGLEDGYVQSYPEIGSSLDLSVSRIRQIEIDAIWELKLQVRQLTGEDVRKYNQTESQIVRIIGNTLVNMIWMNGKEEALKYLAEVEEKEWLGSDGLIEGAGFSLGYGVLEEIENLRIQFKL